MATLRTGQTTNFSNQGTEFEVEAWDTDGASVTETYYIPDFPKWNGFYREVGEFKKVVNKFASWTFGRKIKADKNNQAKLDKIRGTGKESARTVSKNAWRVAMICGDSFAHIITDRQGRLTNLKPLNPGKVAIVANSSGIIIAFEQTLGDGKTMRYDPEEIYHLSYDREADEIHGIPLPEAIESLLESRKEGLRDLRTLYHRTVKPILFYEAETDDLKKLNSLETTINSAFKDSESIVISKGVVGEIKRSSSPQFSGNDINSLKYLKFLIRVFVTDLGMPEVVMGWGEETTEASAKVIITSYEQEIWDMKIYNEEAAKIQLNIEYEIEPAPSLMDELQKDTAKDGPEKAVQSNDQELNSEGRK